jgi:tellurite resistance protein TerC
MRALRKALPVTRDLHCQRLFTRIHGRLHATPMLLALGIIETSDIIFAIDSVPAIFAITREPLIV